MKTGRRPYYWKLTAESDKKVRKNTVERLVERHKRNWDAWDDRPVLEFPTGREELAFYRSREYGWWAELAATYPDRAAWRLRRYAKLVRLYGLSTPVMA